MIIQSFSIAYSPEEDRLLLQARGDNANQNFWITRRAALMLSQALQSLLKDVYAQSGVQGEHLSLAQSFGQEHAKAEHAPFTGKIQRPNDQPLLLFRIDYGVIGVNQGRLILLNAAGAGQEYKLNTEMMHALSNLIIQQCTNAEWLVALEPLPKKSTLETFQKILH